MFGDNVSWSVQNIAVRAALQSQAGGRGGWWEQEAQDCVTRVQGSHPNSCL